MVKARWRELNTEQMALLNISDTVEGENNAIFG